MKAMMYIASTVSIGNPVLLSAEESFDSEELVCHDLALVTYDFTFISIPPGSSLTNTDITKPYPEDYLAEFTPDVIGDFEIQLEFTDDSTSYSTCQGGNLEEAQPYSKTSLFTRIPLILFLSSGTRCFIYKTIAIILGYRKTSGCCGINRFI